MKEWLIAALVGALTGILSGFGIGGGSLLLIYLTTFAALPQTAAQGINLLYFLPAAAASLPTHWKQGSVERSALLPAILCGLCGTALAALAATAMDVTLLRRCFGGFLLLIGLHQLLKKAPEGSE